MGRALRQAPGGLIYHALNRANGRLTTLREAADYAAFERIPTEARRRIPVDLLAYCLMPNHWHLLRRRAGEREGLGERTLRRWSEVLWVRLGDGLL